MNLFLSTLSQMGFLLILMIVGFILVKSKVVPDSSTQIISKLENNVFIPALVMGTFMTKLTPDNLGDYGKFVLCGAAVVVVSIPIAILVAKAFSKDSYLRNIYTYGLAFSNFGFMGNAVVQALFPDWFDEYLIFVLPFWAGIYVWGVPFLLMPATGKKRSFADWIKPFLNPMFAGMLIGILIHLFPAAAILLRPLLTVVRSTPVASFVILVWSFTGSAALPFVIAALMVAPIVADELATGLATTDRALDEMTALFGFSPYRRFIVYRLPAALPYLFGAVTTSVGFAWKAGVAAEILAATARSVGREIYFSKLTLAIDELWAWTVAVVILSLILELIVKKTLRFIRRRSL
jgi:NitT/TauT family transport system permease protein